jgi:hypothetical protein
MITIRRKDLHADTLQKLKTNIWFKMNIPFSYQILWYNGTQIKEDTFSSLPKDAIIELEVKITRH